MIKKHPKINVESTTKEWKHLCCFVSDLSSPGGPLDHHSLSSEQNFSDNKKEFSENFYLSAHTTSVSFGIPTKAQKGSFQMMVLFIHLCYS